MQNVVKKREIDEQCAIVMEKVKLKFISQITMPDGEIIERAIETTEGIPSPEEFDFSSRDGFLKHFDTFEKTVLEARNKIAAETAEGYLAEISKKNK